MRTFVRCSYRGIAQLVEQRSPKPRAEGSSPSAPAKTKSTPRGVLFVLARVVLASRGARSVPGNACERRRWRIQRAGVGAAVEIRRAIARKANFGHRKRGCEATSSPSAPAKPSSIEYQGLRAIFMPGISDSFYAEKRIVLTFF